MADGQIKVTMSADLAAAARALREQKQRQQEMADALGITRTEVKRLERSLQSKEKTQARSTQATQKASQATKQLQRYLRSQERAEQQATKATRRGAAQNNMMTGSLVRMVPAAGAATSAMTSLGMASTAAAGPIGIAVAAIAAVSVGSFRLASSMSETVDEFTNSAKSAGVSTRSYIALSHAIEAAGGNVSQLQTTLQFFVRTQDLAGKSAEEVDQALRSEIQRIEAIANPADQAAERMRVFGTRSSEAAAALSSGAMDRATAKTRRLADAVEAASTSSAMMDESAADMNRAFTELSVVVGDQLAPSIVAITESITGTVDAFGDAIKFGESYGITLGRLGLVGMQLEYAGSVARSNREQRQQIEAFKAAKIEADAYGKTMGDRIIEQFELAEAMQGATLAPEVQPGITKAEAAAEKKRRDEAINRARKTAEEVEKARAAVAARARQEAFAEEVSEEERRRAQIEAGRLLEVERQAEDAAELARLHEENLRRMDEEAEHLRQVRDLRAQAALAGVSGLADLVQASGASAKAIAVGRIAEITAYGGVAFARALAEFGPLAGLPIAISTAAQVGSQIAAVQAAPTRHMGSMAPDEGMIRVRNGERATIEPATTRGKERSTPTVVQLEVGNRVFRAQRASVEREDRIHGDRRRWAREV